ncbi:MAG: NTP transferase domain-containing protein [Haloarculaceae archaeon]
MCGGRGTRLDSEVEKPLFEVGGEAMVDRVRRALDASGAERTLAVTAPHAPATRDHLDGRLPLVETPGEGYVADLDAALADARVESPVLTVAADLPLLAGAAIDRVLAAHEGDESLTVCVPAALKERLGVSADTTFEGRDCRLAPTGVNVVDTTEDSPMLSYDTRLAVNVNRRSDAAVAEGLLCD